MTVSAKANRVPRFYESRKWRQARKAALERGGWVCSRCGCELPRSGPEARFSIAHHIHPVADHPVLGYEQLNLEAMCSSCHSRHHRNPYKGCDELGNPYDPNHPWNRWLNRKNKSGG